MRPCIATRNISCARSPTCCTYRPIKSLPRSIVRRKKSPDANSETAMLRSCVLLLLCIAMPTFAQTPTQSGGADMAAIDAALAAERYPGDREQDARRKSREVMAFLEIAPGHHALDFYTGPGY